MTEVERDRARRAARFAAVSGLPVTVCPYRPGSSDNTQRALALVWVRTYLALRPAAAT